MYSEVGVAPHPDLKNPRSRVNIRERFSYEIKKEGANAPSSMRYCSTAGSALTGLSRLEPVIASSRMPMKIDW